MHRVCLSNSSALCTLTIIKIKQNLIPARQTSATQSHFGTDKSSFTIYRTHAHRSVYACTLLSVVNNSRTMATQCNTARPTVHSPNNTGRTTVRAHLPLHERVTLWTRARFDVTYLPNVSHISNELPFIGNQPAFRILYASPVHQSLLLLNNAYIMLPRADQFRLSSIIYQFPTVLFTRAIVYIFYIGVGQ